MKLLFFLITKKVNTVYHIVSSSQIGFIRDFMIIRISKLLGKKIIIHSHNGNYDLFYNSNSKFKKRIIYNTINKADKIILLSPKLRYTFSFIKNDEKFVFIPNGLPINQLSNKKMKHKEVISVLYLSNLIESKGYLDIIEAIILLKKSGNLSRFQFHFAGGFMLNSSQDKSYATIEGAEKLFFGMIKKHELSEFITYHGIVQGKEKDDLLHRADVFLLPSYYCVEAQPITIIEALAYGCAIYATNYRGIPDMLIDGFNGEFVKSCNPESIADKMKDIDDQKIINYSKNSLELFENNFTKEKHLNKMFDVLNNRK